jgi:hypothetical protein
MSDQVIGLPVDGAGKKLDTEELLVNAITVQRERDQVAGKGDVEIAEVKNTDLAGDDYALAVRQVPEASPQSDYATSVSLAVGASTDLDASTIAAATTGKLLRVEVGSTAPCEWAVKTRDGGVEVVIAVLFTSGLTGGQPSRTYSPKSKDSVTLAGAGVDENFRVTATNIGNQAFEAADVHATIEWDEV